MKRLPDYAKALILKGASTLGNFTEGLSYVEENILVKDWKELSEFCKWIDQTTGGAASGNIDMLFNAFKNPGNLELQGRVEDLAAKIRYIKSL